jgi:hypothetical protein
MNLGHGLTVVGAALSLGAGGLTTWNTIKHTQTPAQTIVSQAGRDQVLIRMLQGAKKSVYLRTEALALVPAGNELAQACQRSVVVTVELPLASGLIGEESRLPRILMDLGAVVIFKSDAVANYRGTYVVVDGTRFLYSAAPLGLSPPGALVSYVAGVAQ